MGKCKLGEKDCFCNKGPIFTGGKNACVNYDKGKKIKKPSANNV